MVDPAAHPDDSPLVPEPPPRGLLDPQLAADRARFPKCPLCGSNVYREPLASTPSVKRIVLGCMGLDCTFRQRIEIDADGTARTIGELDCSPPPPKVGKKSAIGASLKTAFVRCIVPGCRSGCVESGFCQGHRSMWIADGRPAGKLGWAESIAPPPRIRQKAREKGLQNIPKIIPDPAPQPENEVSEPAEAEPVASSPQIKTTLPITEPPMDKSCVCIGCQSGQRIVGQGLCVRHYTRWISVDKPEGEAFKKWSQAGGPSKRDLANGGASPAPARVRAQPAAPKVTTATSPAPAAADLSLINYGLISFPRPVDAIRIQVIGRYRYIFDGDGGLLCQHLLEAK